jgi:hypothetical protein
VSIYSPRDARPPTLAERLEKLNDNLQTLGGRLQEAIAHAVGEAVANAVRDGVRNLLARMTRPPTSDVDADDGEEQRPDYDRYADDNLYEDDRDPFGPDHGQRAGYGRRGRGLWSDDRPCHRTTPTSATTRNGGRWLQAFGAAFQAGCWWLRQQKSRRPVLTTAAITLVAGVTTFFVGPAVGAAVGVLVSATTLILTAHTANTAAEGTTAAVD